MPSSLAPRTLVQRLSAALSPRSMRRRSLLGRLAAVLVGTALLALSSQIAVPMLPVPITMQTFAVTFIGAVYGWRLGMVTVMAWLAQAAMGLPVLAGGSGGLLPFVGPTAGYLWGFPLAAALAGWLAERGCDGRRFLPSITAMLLANLLCLVTGGLWLAALFGFEKAIVLGVAPFLIGAVLKSALAAVILRLMRA